MSIMTVALSFGLKDYTAPNTTSIVEEWQVFYQATVTGDVDSTLGTFQYDLVDIGWLVNFFYDLYTMFSQTYATLYNDINITNSEKGKILQPIVTCNCK